MIYAPIPIKIIPHCPLLDEEDNNNDDIYKGIILKNKIITRTKSLKIKKYKNKHIKGYGISKKYNKNIFFNNKYILYINNNENNKKIIKYYKINNDNKNIYIDKNLKKYIIKEIDKNKFKLYNIIHNVNKRN